MERTKGHYTLIDCLFESTNLYVISDLHYKSNLGQIIPILKDIDENTISIVDWIETCQYIMGMDYMNVETQKEAKEMLLMYCKSASSMEKGN